MARARRPSQRRCQGVREDATPVVEPAADEPSKATSPERGADAGRRNPPRSSRGSKSVGRDYTDLVRPLTASTSSRSSSSGASRDSNPPSGVPTADLHAPPPPAFTLRTVVVDGVIKQASCVSYVPPKTKLTLRRTKQGWGVSGKAAASASAAGSQKTSKSATVTSQTASDKSAADDVSSAVVMPDEELTKRLKRLYSRKTSAVNSKKGGHSVEVEQLAENNAQNHQTLVKEASDNLTSEIVASDVSCSYEEEQPSGNIEAQSTKALSENAKSERAKFPEETRRSSPLDEGAFRNHALMEEVKFERNALESEPFVFPAPVITVSKVRLHMSKEGLKQANSCGADADPPRERKTSPMLSSLLENAGNGSAKLPVNPTDDKSCELLKHLLANSTKEKMRGMIDAVKTAQIKCQRNETKEMNARLSGSPQTKRGWDFNKGSGNVGIVLDPKCKETPSPLTNQPINDKPISSTLWNFLNDPKIGIPDPLLIPISRMTALLSQPIVELANLSTFTAEALKYIGWHPAFRNVDILQVSRDRLYRLLKDPRVEVKLLLTDPNARVLGCGKEYAAAAALALNGNNNIKSNSPSAAAGSPPAAAAALSVVLAQAYRTAAGVQQHSATNSLLRQKLMSRSGLTPPSCAMSSARTNDYFGFGGSQTSSDDDVAVGYRTALPILSPLYQTFSEPEVRFSQANKLQHLLNKPLYQPTLLTDEVTILPVAAGQKRSIREDAVPAIKRRRVPPALRPLRGSTAADSNVRLEPHQPPCPEDELDMGIIAADLVQTCMEEGGEAGGDGQTSRAADPGLQPPLNVCPLPAADLNGPDCMSDRGGSGRVAGTSRPLSQTAPHVHNPVLNTDCSGSLDSPKQTEVCSLAAAALILQASDSRTATSETTTGGGTSVVSDSDKCGGGVANSQPRSSGDSDGRSSGVNEPPDANDDTCPAEHSTAAANRQGTGLGYQSNVVLPDVDAAERQLLETADDPGSTTEDEEDRLVINEEDSEDTTAAEAAITPTSSVGRQPDVTSDTISSSGSSTRTQCSIRVRSTVELLENPACEPLNPSSAGLGEPLTPTSACEPPNLSSSGPSMPHCTNGTPTTASVHEAVLALGSSMQNGFDPGVAVHPSSSASAGSMLPPTAVGSVKRPADADLGGDPQGISASPKRPRLEEKAMPLNADPLQLRTVDMVENSLHRLKREVKAIDLLSRQKEREWDCLLKLRKAKEETFLRLRRKREVLLMYQPQPILRATVPVGAASVPAVPAPVVVPAGPSTAPVSSTAIASPPATLRQMIEARRRSVAEITNSSQNGHQGDVRIPASVVGAPSADSNMAPKLKQPPGVPTDPAPVPKVRIQPVNPQHQTVGMVAPPSTASSSATPVAAVRPTPLSQQQPQHAQSTEISLNDVPRCQGCQTKRAQFVCAGCGRQWYCSRECQVKAWEIHAEDCGS